MPTASVLSGGRAGQWGSSHSDPVGSRSRIRRHQWARCRGQRPQRAAGSSSRSTTGPAGSRTRARTDSRRSSVPAIWCRRRQRRRLCRSRGAQRAGRGGARYCILFGPTFTDRRTCWRATRPRHRVGVTLNSDTAAPDLATANPGNRQFGADVSLLLSQGGGTFTVGDTIGVCPEDNAPRPPRPTRPPRCRVPRHRPTPEGPPACFAVAVAAGRLRRLDITIDVAVAVRRGNRNTLGRYRALLIRAAAAAATQGAAGRCRLSRWADIRSTGQRRERQGDRHRRFRR